MSEDQDKWTNQIKQTLDQQSDALDGETVSKLRQARARVLETSERSHSSWLGQHSGAAVALASISILAVAVWLAVPTTSNTEMAAQVIDDLELLAATEELEFYKDMDFYYWLEAQDNQNGSNSQG